MVKWSHPGKGVAPYLSVVTPEKGTFVSPSTIVAIFTYYLLQIVLFQIIQFSMSELKSAKYCYVSLTIQ